MYTMHLAKINGQSHITCEEGTTPPYTVQYIFLFGRIYTYILFSIVIEMIVIVTP